MHMCSIVTESEGGRIVIRVAGVFDPASAFELRDWLEREPAGDLVLDFSQVVEFVDLGVATLAHGLAGDARRHVRLRGLHPHQLRIFRHFGVAVERLARSPGRRH